MNHSYFKTTILICLFFLSSSNIKGQILLQQMRDSLGIYIYSYINETGRTIFKLPNDHRPQGTFHNGRLLVQGGGANSYYYVNKKGEKIKDFNDPKHTSYSYPIEEGFGRIKIISDEFNHGQQKYYTNELDEPVFNIPFYDAHPFSEGLAFVQLDIASNVISELSPNASWAVINTKGEIIFSLKDEKRKIKRVHPFKEGIARIDVPYGYFYIDKNGEKLWETEKSEQVFGKGSYFSEGIANRKLKGAQAYRSDHVFFDQNMKELFTIKDVHKVSDFKEGLCWIVLYDVENSTSEKRYYKDHFIDKNGKIVAQFVNLKIASDLNQGIYKVALPTHNAASLYGFNHIDGRTIIQPQYKKAYFYDNQYIIGEMRHGRIDIYDYEGNLIYDFIPEDEVKRAFLPEGVPPPPPEPKERK